MKGAKRQRPSGAWELRVYAGRDPVTKKERVRTKTFRGGARQADNALRAFVTEVEEQKAGGSKASLRYLLERWLTQIRRQGHSPTTLREYERIITKTINPAIGSKTLRKLTARDLDDLYGSLTDRGLAPASVRQVHSILRAALAQGVKWEYLALNPAASASPPKVRKQEPKAPTPAEVLAIIAHADKDDPELAAFVALAAATGARRGELCGLRWGDVDWKRGTLTIERSIATMGRRNQVVKGTKTHAKRTVALDAFGIRVLKAHRARVEAHADDLDVELGPDSPVISYDLERPVSPDTVSHYVRAAATAVGVDTHLHSIRHYSATQLIAAGVDVRTVAGRLGHADASTTLRVYAHALPERDREAAAVLGRTLKGALPAKSPRKRTPNKDVRPLSPRRKPPTVGPKKEEQEP